MVVSSVVFATGFLSFTVTTLSHTETHLIEANLVSFEIKLGVPFVLCPKDRREGLYQKSRV